MAARTADLDVHVCGIRYDGSPPDRCPDPGAHRNYARVPARAPEPPARSQFDPVPHLAALIDGLGGALAAGWEEPGYAPLLQALADLACGPYARLRGGLLLDDRGREGVTTEQAIREALREAP